MRARNGSVMTQWPNALRLWAASLALVASACSQDNGAPSAIIIGAAIAKSGPLAPVDEGPFKALQLAIDAVNARGGLLGRPLRLVSADTKSDISYGATAAQLVIDRGASLVVVTCDYDFGSAAANIANARGLITFSTCAGDPKFGPRGIGPNAYTMAVSSPSEAVVMAEWAHAAGYRSAYVLLATDTAFDASFADGFKKRWIELHGTAGFYGQDTFASEDSQIATQITRLKSLPAPPDVVVVCAAPPAGVSAVRQIRAAGITQPLLGSDSWDGDFWLSGVPSLNGMYFVTYASIFGTDPRPPMQDFFTRFAARFGAPPVQSNAVTGYSVVEAWVRAVERAHSLDTDKVRAALDGFAAEPLLVGPTTFSPQSHINNARDMIVMEITAGKQGKVVGVFAPQAP
jgi:branched-chain amino acid transport system substrate-binding protein